MVRFGMNFVANEDTQGVGEVPDERLKRVGTDCEVTIVLDLVAGSCQFRIWVLLHKTVA